MGLNATQESTLGLIFHWAKENNRPLVTLNNLRDVISYLTSDEGKADLKSLGGVSPTTAGVILRALVNLEGEGGDTFFGEPKLDPKDLLRDNDQGQGIISLLEFSGQSLRPVIFSTFLMWLLADLFTELPEVGDVDKPKLVFFFDEAHLLFADASKAFLEQVEQTVKLIRSKGVGVFFCTQLPTDLPNDVLSQLGARVQHALRAFTPDDQKALSKTVRTYPENRCLRPGIGADVAGYRRGRRHRAVGEGRAHAGRVDAHARTTVADGRHRHGRDHRGGQSQPAASQVRPDDRRQNPRPARTAISPASERPLRAEPDYPPLSTDFEHRRRCPSPRSPKAPPCGRKC